MYPGDWIVNTDKDNGIMKVTVRKDGYELFFGFFETGPEICDYHDEYSPGNDIPSVKSMPSEFIQISGINSQIRRSISSSQSTSQVDYYDLCRLDAFDDTQYYQEYLPGIAGVTSPKGNPTPIILKTIDDILATIK